MDPDTLAILAIVAFAAALTLAFGADTLAILALGAAAAAAGTSAYSSYASAEQQNDAAKRSMESVARGAAVQQKQLLSAADVERDKRISEERAITGRLRVAMGEAGVMGGSYDALQRQVDWDTARSLDILNTNLLSQQELVQSGAQANLAQLSGSYHSPVLGAFLGGMQGAQSGLAIAKGGVEVYEAYKNIVD